MTTSPTETTPPTGLASFFDRIDALDLSVDAAAPPLAAPAASTPAETKPAETKQEAVPGGDVAARWEKSAPGTPTEDPDERPEADLVARPVYEAAPEVPPAPEPGRVSSGPVSGAPVDSSAPQSEAEVPDAEMPDAEALNTTRTGPETTGPETTGQNIAGTPGIRKGRSKAPLTIAREDLKRAVEPVWRASLVTVNALERAAIESGFIQTAGWVADTPDYFGQLKHSKADTSETRGVALEAVIPALKRLCEIRGLETEPQKAEPLYAEPIEQGLAQDKAAFNRAANRKRT
tara:strand:- start:1665 stop:2534 length:870 start_codon:yes stop_codon:yes gene_type:complete